MGIKSGCVARRKPGLEGKIGQKKFRGRNPTCCRENDTDFCIENGYKCTSFENCLENILEICIVPCSMWAHECSSSTIIPKIVLENFLVSRANLVEIRLSEQLPTSLR